MGGLIALRLEESVDALPDQILPTWSACGPQSARLNRDDFPCTYAHSHTHGERLLDIYPTELCFTFQISKLQFRSEVA